MMMAKADILEPFILYWEGGYVKDPDDSGGTTNKGVTLQTFRRVFGKGRTEEDLRNMTDQQWLVVFRKYFWDKWRGDEIQSQSVANILVDWVWLSGNWGIKLPQELLGVKADGVVGDKTLAALNKREPQALFLALKKRRERYIKDLVRKNKRKKKYERGWLNRLNAISYGQLKYGGTMSTF